MASTQQSLTHTMLPSALANAALLIAAPSLGCLKTYTKTFSDLCKAYNVPVPDLTHILEHRPMAQPMITPVRSSFTITPKKLVNCLETNDTMDFTDLKLELSDITEEIEIPEFNEKYYCISAASSLVSKSLGSDITIKKDNNISDNLEDIDESIDSDNNNAASFDSLSDSTEEIELPEFNEKYYCISAESSLASESDITITEDNDISNSLQDIDVSIVSYDNTAVAFDNLDWFDEFESKASLQLTTLSSPQVVTDLCTSTVIIPKPSHETSSPMNNTIGNSKTDENISTTKAQPVQKSFSCSLCKQRFSMRQSLLIHRVTEVCTNADKFLRPVTGGWTCTSCSKVFGSRAQALRHTWGTLTCSTDKGRSCPVCHKEFEENACNFLVKHVKETHQEYFDSIES